MTQFNDPNRGILSLRRLTLLGSVAVVGAALVLGGPLEYGHFTSQAHAATTQAQQGPAGFADLIAKVKPAVISVRVKVDQGATDDDSPNTGGHEAAALHAGIAVRAFLRRQRPARLRAAWGAAAPDDHRRRLGLLHFADGYAVTNNHVVDHAESVQVTTDDGTIYTAKVVGTDPEDRSRADQGRRQEGFPLRQILGRAAAGRRLGGRGRQSLRPRRHRDRRHRLGARPRYRRGPL